VAPAVDIFEGKDDLLLYADMPGVRKDDVSIHIDRGELTIHATRAYQQSGRSPLTAERPSIDYRRTFALQGVDADRVEAELSAGVLKLRLPRSSTLRPRQIAVKSG
jgi:HSP20 family protein